MSKLDDYRKELARQSLEIMRVFYRNLASNVVDEELYENFIREIDEYYSIKQSDIL